MTNAQNRQKPLSQEQHQAITAIPAEFSRLKHRAGMLSMARDDDDVNSAETSFSFMLGTGRPSWTANTPSSARWCGGSRCWR